VGRPNMSPSPLLLIPGCGRPTGSPIAKSEVDAEYSPLPLFHAERLPRSRSCLTPLSCLSGYSLCPVAMRRDGELARGSFESAALMSSSIASSSGGPLFRLAGRPAVLLVVLALAVALVALAGRRLTGFLPRTVVAFAAPMPEEEACPSGANRLGGARSDETTESDGTVYPRDVSLVGSLGAGTV